MFNLRKSCGIFGFGRLLVITLCVVGMMFVLTACGSKTENTLSTNQAGNEGSNEVATTIAETVAATNSTLDANLTYYAVIDIKDFGTIKVKLDQQSAPITVANFVSLAESGFYDGLTFHRIIAGFMMQGGDPEGTGMGGSENRIVGEFAANGYDNTLTHTRGVISMARSNDYNSARSQFFIMHEDSPHLDGQYAAFGCVTEGIEVVDAICNAAMPTDGNGSIAPEEQPVINSIKIVTE